MCTPNFKCRLGKKGKLLSILKGIRLSIFDQRYAIIRKSVCNNNCPIFDFRQTFIESELKEDINTWNSSANDTYTNAMPVSNSVDHSIPGSEGPVFELGRADLCLQTFRHRVGWVPLCPNMLKSKLASIRSVCSQNHIPITAVLFCMLNSKLRQDPRIFIRCCLFGLSRTHLCASEKPSILKFCWSWLQVSGVDGSVCNVTQP